METRSEVQALIHQATSKWQHGQATYGKVIVSSFCRRQLENLEAPDHQAFRALETCSVDEIHWDRSVIHVSATASRPGYGTVALTIQVHVTDKPKDQIIWLMNFEPI